MATGFEADVDHGGASTVKLRELANGKLGKSQNLDLKFDELLPGLDAEWRPINWFDLISEGDILLVLLTDS